VKPWTAVINHSRASGKPPQTTEFDWYEALRTYLSPDSEVVAIAIYRASATTETLCPRSAPSCRCALASGANLTFGTGTPSPSSLRSAPSPAMRARGCKMRNQSPSPVQWERGASPQGWVGEGLWWQSSV